MGWRLHVSVSCAPRTSSRNVVTNPTSCHNLIHEDHEMLAAFNVTALSDFGYNETTRFIDPMEERYRATGFSDTDYSGRTGPFSQDKITEKLNFFIGLDAYNKVNDVEKALEAYWATHTPGAAGSAVKTATAAASTASGATTRTGAAVTPTGAAAASSAAPSTLKTVTSSAKGNQNQNQNQNGKATATSTAK